MTDIYIDQYNQEIHTKYLQGTGFNTQIKALPTVLDTIYNKALNLKQYNNIIYIGDSASRDILIAEELLLPTKWSISNLAVYSATGKDFEILFNYIQEYGRHKIDKSDIVIINIWYFTFVKSSLHGSRVKNIVELNGYYKVDDNLRVSGKVGEIQGNLVMLGFKLKMGLSYLLFGTPEVPFSLSLESIAILIDRLMKVSTKIIPPKNKFKDIKTRDANTINEYKQYWMNIMNSTTIPGESTESFKRFLTALQTVTNVVVININSPSWHRDISYYIDYERWFRIDLVPFMDKQNIRFINFIDSISDSAYVDSCHLSFKACQQVNAMLGTYLLKIVKTIDK
ncbi:MAG: hypothetical protein HQL06_04910 [Nitrospirae bacterium]|nr:hypothetical protein [Nitrospirota bacterium]